ncbi:hypothetical protein AJ79_01309 [Helicocarpus griseus UAMH5409]|uniref:Uncharacterized protein n=1 Tax=Helicocarpus griseus UAMH5409 TaxID=1447875 RepID=A0A2B7Y7Z1_9EURO|nr:hypothetical protein AJ79_01309 [Helicocarpus griseus UAMH5409]
MTSQYRGMQCACHQPSEYQKMLKQTGSIRISDELPARSVQVSSKQINTEHIHIHFCTSTQFLTSKNTILQYNRSLSIKTYCHNPNLEMPIQLTPPSSGAGAPSDLSSTSDQPQQQSQQQQLSQSQPQQPQTGTSPAAAPSSHMSQHAGSQLSKEEVDKIYQERMEEEYAKREGGA